MRKILYLFVLLFFIAPIAALDNETVNLTITPTQTPLPSNRTIFAEPPGHDGRPTMVYYGEVVSVWDMIGWADENGNYAMDYWFYNHSCGYRRADIVVDIGRPRAVVVNHDTFPFEGYYYQHQLEGDTACSPIIDVREGKRLANTTDEEARQGNMTVQPVVYDDWPELPDKGELFSDYIFARGDPINLTGTGAAWLWMFHPSKNIYLLQQPNNGTIPSHGLEPGRYDGILQYFGNNTAIGVFYYPENDEVRCSGQQPRRITNGTGIGEWYKRDLMIGLDNRACSDDDFWKVKILVDEPFADISDLFEKENSTASELRVQGYTNLKPGSRIHIVWDRDNWRSNQDLRLHMSNTTVYSDNMGMYRKFRATIPYDPKELGPGQHKMSVLTEFGTETSVDFWIYEIPEGSKKPAGYLRYIDRNLFIPTPTPVIIINETVRIEERVRIDKEYVNVTPSYETVARAQSDALLGLVGFIIQWVAYCAAAIVAGYFGSVVIRAWRRK